MAKPLSSGMAWPIANPIWAGILNTLLANPTNSIQILNNVTLISGQTIINHGLGRQMKGWFLIDLQGQVSYPPYRSAPLNDLTLTLTSGTAVTCSLGVF